MGSYRILLHGDARSVNKILSAVATRVSWFVGAMLLAIATGVAGHRMPASSVASPA
jgi:hypothetical protein